ncbi:hypothetical protein ACIRBX_34780 [Kitasatospora sp. NPDC096147]|uniref:hypothetical protein n=1 Tax=Kitasatospora sp. NPDC096147 TaxID=3364093 RepID=UPI00382CC67A
MSVLVLLSAPLLLALIFVVAALLRPGRGAAAIGRLGVARARRRLVELHLRNTPDHNGYDRHGSHAR